MSSTPFTTPCRRRKRTMSMSKAGWTRSGRDWDDVKILPALRPVVGRTVTEAQAKFDQLQALLDPLVGLARLNGAFGDLSGYPLDGPVPMDVLGPNEMKSGTERLRARVQREQPTIRQLYQQVAGMGGFCLIGTAAQIVDVMQTWFDIRRATGSISRRRICPRGVRISSSLSFRNCSAAACSVVSMRVGRCGRTSG